MRLSKNNNLETQGPDTLGLGSRQVTNIPDTA